MVRPSRCPSRGQTRSKPSISDNGGQWEKERERKVKHQSLVRKAGCEGEADLIFVKRPFEGIRTPDIHQAGSESWDSILGCGLSRPFSCGGPKIYQRESCVQQLAKFVSLYCPITPPSHHYKDTVAARGSLSLTDVVKSLPLLPFLLSILYIARFIFDWILCKAGSSKVRKDRMLFVSDGRFFANCAFSDVKIHLCLLLGCIAPWERKAVYNLHLLLSFTG